MKLNTENSMRKKINAHFFVVAIAIAVGVYILFAERGGEYIVKSEILLLPKNEKTVLQLDKVRENIVFIFYKNNGREELSKKENISLITEKENSFIMVETRSYNLENSIENSIEASREVVNIASKYYNIKTDLDIRIIDRKVSESGRNIFFLLLISIGIGASLSFIIQLLIRAVEGSVVEFSTNKKKTVDVSRDIEGLLMRNKSKIEELSYSPERKPERKEKEVDIVENDKLEDNFKKASSPQNLPIEPIESESMPESLPLESESSQDLTGEPTEEEYKKRLNQLLRGK